MIRCFNLQEFVSLRGFFEKKNNNNTNPSGSSQLVKAPNN